MSAKNVTRLLQTLLILPDIFNQHMKESSMLVINVSNNLQYRKVLPHRGGDTSMAGMAIAIPGVLNISKTGYTMGKIR